MSYCARAPASHCSTSSTLAGTKRQPLNRWRIVHLTQATDHRLTAVFEHMAENPWLAEHTEIYIRHNLGIQLPDGSSSTFLPTPGE